jgi:hypothetical protein
MAVSCDMQAALAADKAALSAEMTGVHDELAVLRSQLAQSQREQAELHHQLRDVVRAGLCPFPHLQHLCNTPDYGVF